MIRAAAIGIVLAALVAPVAAQPAGLQAEALFRQAKELMAQKKFAEACKAFAASQKLDPAISTQLNEADCREKNAQLATAWGLFVDVERQTRGDAQKAQLHDVAVARAKKLDARMSTMTIVVAKPTPGLAITRNGEPVSDAAWNQKLPIDGGEYKIVAKAAGHKDWSATITIAAESDPKTVDVPVLEDATGTPVVTTTTKPQPDGPHQPPRPRVTEHHHSRGAPIALSIGAGVLGAGAIGLELVARSTYDKALAEKTDQPHRTSLWQSANHERYADEALAVAGIACAGVAVWLFVRGGHDEESRVSIGPMVTPSSSGLVLDGHF